MQALGPGPLARLYDTALRLGITVLGGAASAGTWPDDGIAAVVGFGACIAIGPGLHDEGERADVFAMALIIAAVMSDCASDHPCAVTAPGGLVLISRIRLPEPASGPGKLATLLARKCGRSTASAAFEYSVPTVSWPRTSPAACWPARVLPGWLAGQGLAGSADRGAFA